MLWIVYAARPPRETASQWRQSSMTSFVLSPFADARTCHFWRFLRNLNLKMLSAIVWTPKRHIFTSQRVFWTIMREIPCTGYFSRRVRRKNENKKEALYFTYFARRSLTADWHKFWVTCSFVDLIKCAKFYHNRLRVWILWGVEVWPFPLDCDVAVNTVRTTVHTVIATLQRARDSVTAALYKCFVVLYCAKRLENDGINRS